MNNRLTQSVKAYVQRGRERAAYGDGRILWQFMPDRVSVLLDQRERAWRAYWRAIFFQTAQELQNTNGKDDWALGNNLK